MNLGELSGFLFNGFCRALGCGGEAGFLLVGIVIIVAFIIILGYSRIGADGSLAIMSLLILGLATGGLLPSWTGTGIWIGMALIWGLLIMRWVKK